MRLLSLVPIVTCALAQAQDSRLTFEVASVKMHNGGGAYLDGGPGSKDPTQFTFVGASMAALLRRTFAAETYRISAPAGLPDGRFDIRAKVPPDTREPEFDHMLENLLIERFAMKVHHETRELAGYELIVAKSGLRMKPAERTTNPPAADIPVGLLTPIKDRQGELELPPGRNAHLVFRLSDGRFRHSGRMQTMAEIVAMCSRELGQPVADRTGLTGVYDFNVDFMRMPDEPDVPRNDSETPFLNAFQAQLGLRVEAKKIPVDVVVIDHIDKLPAGN